MDVLILEEAYYLVFFIYHLKRILFISLYSNTKYRVWYKNFVKLERVFNWFQLQPFLFPQQQSDITDVICKYYDIVKNQSLKLSD